MTAPTAPTPEEYGSDADRSVSLLISGVLRSGLLIACLCMIAGALIHLFQHPEHDLQLSKFRAEPEDLRSVAGIFRLSMQGNGLGIMQLAVLMLWSTPVLRVIFSAIAFLKQRDWKFVVISLSVLCIMMIGLLSGKAMH